MFGRCVVASLILMHTLPSSAAQSARVITDGAIVYRQPDFDAKVLGYFRAGQRVDISSKKFATAFFRVRFRQGVIGYIADVDVEGGISKAPDKPEDKSKAEQTRKKASERNKPMIAKTFLGIMGGYTAYSEIINKVEYKDNLPTYGGKLSFPFDNSFVMDFNAVMSLSAPKFYRDLSSIAPKGYMAIFSAVLNYPLFDFADRRGVLYMGGGPGVMMTSYMIEVSGSKLDISEIRMGGVFNLGLAFDLGGAVFKLEPKYYIEKASYNSIDIALQFSL